MFYNMYMFSNHMSFLCCKVVYDSYCRSVFAFLLIFNAMEALYHI